MAEITKEKWEENGFEAIVSKNGEFWINERHLKQKMGHSNLPVVTNKYDSMYKKSRSELADEAKYRRCRNFIHNDLAKKSEKTLRTPDLNAFRRG